MRLAVAHPLASQANGGLLSVTDETDGRQPGRDGKSHQQESFEDYLDHYLVLYTSEVGIIHQAHSDGYSGFSLLYSRLRFIIELKKRGVSA